MQIKDIGDSRGPVFHYTKLENFANIVRKEGIVFHAGRYDAMNDPEDSVFGALNVEKSFGPEIAYAISDPNTCNISPYLVSFCRRDDLPLMWRLYNAEITLHIDSDIIKDYCQRHSKMMMISDVDYLDEDEIDKKVFETFAEANKFFAHEELDFAAKARTTFIKHIDFSCEEEWRVAWFDDYDTIDDEAKTYKLSKDEVASEIKSKCTKYHALSFFRELKFPADCLTGVTIHAFDNKEYETIRRQMRVWLAQCGYDLKKITIGKTKTHRVR